VRRTGNFILYEEKIFLKVISIKTLFIICVIIDKIYTLCGRENMPVHMIHLFVAKKVNPNASLAFYVGNLAPDAVRDGDTRSDKKIKSHFYDAPDRDDVLRKFALNANNDYLKGYLLHLFADIQFHVFWKKNTTFPPYKFGEESWTKFMEENNKIEWHDFYFYVDIRFCV